MKPEDCWATPDPHIYNESKAQTMAFEMWKDGGWISSYPVLGWPSVEKGHLITSAIAEQINAARTAEVRIPVLYFDVQPEDYMSIDTFPISQYNQIWPQ